jgi:hypothetical protein
MQMASEENQVAEIAILNYDLVNMEPSLFVHYHQERPPPDVIRKLHPKIIGVQIWSESGE